MALVAEILLLRRLPGFLLLGAYVASIDGRDEAAYVGWFGPVGVAALYYSGVAMERAVGDEVWVATSLVVCASMVVHGMTAAPLSRGFGRRRDTGAGQERSTVSMEGT